MSEQLQSIALPRCNQNTQPDLSIVVMFTHDAEQAERCLLGVETLAENQLAAETIVVLNASSKEVRALVAERTAGAAVIDSPVNTGTAVAWQLAFTAAKANRVLLLHEDAVPNLEMLQRLTATLDADPTAALVGPWLSEKRGGLKSANAGWLLWRDLSQCSLTPADIPDSLHETPYAVDYVSSAISLWDRQAWLEVGGFDERRFPAVGVEVDACTAFWARGKCVLIDPVARGIHTSGAMDSHPGPLSGQRLRYFLSEQYHRDWQAKWAAVGDWLIDLDEHGWSYPWPPETIEMAFENANMRRAQRSQMSAPIPKSLQPFTNPDDEDPPTALSSAMIERLQAAERKTIDEYCTWLVADHAEVSARLEATAKREDELRTEVGRLEARKPIDNADLENLRQRSVTLTAIESGGWWKLRGRLRRLIGKSS